MHLQTLVRFYSFSPWIDRHRQALSVYVDWDYESYCKDCKSRHLSNGGNSEKEEALRKDWEPNHRATMAIRRATTIVDTQDRIIGWILPDLLLPRYQVEVIFHPPL